MSHSIVQAETVASPTYTRRTSCRACGKEDLRPFLSLGPMPLANSFLRSPADSEDERYFPLDVCFCQSCSLVQLADVIAHDVLFRNYIYVTGTSETVARHNAIYAESVVELLNLGSDDLVIEIASNDGSLLKQFQRFGVRTLGVEPASNIAEQARASGIETVSEFFDSTFAEQLREATGPVKALIANNVLAHVDDTQDFLRGCRDLLDEDGMLIIEVPYLRDLIDRLEYDTVYHEHLCYFSVSTLLQLFTRVDLSIVRLDYLPIHGGSLRVYAGRQKRHSNHSPSALRFAEQEISMGLTSLARFQRFAADVQVARQALIEMLEGFKRLGKRVAGYGAPAKGNTLLNYCGIDTGVIPYTVDKNPLKIGLYTPGTHIPVFPVSALLEHQPDYVLILAWNFATEIIEQQNQYQARGGHFIIPVPMAKVV